MALLSDIDWLIILVVGAFLLFGRGNTQAIRTLGKWYSRANHLKQELVGEFARAAELPLPAGTSPGSFRAALLGLGAPPSAGRGIPAAVRTPPQGPAGPAPFAPAAPGAVGFGYVMTSWSTSLSSVQPREGEGK